MQLRVLIGAAVLCLTAFAAGASGQQPPARGAAAGQVEGGGRGAGRGEIPPLLFKEEWKFPPYTGQLNDENRRVTQESVTNPRLELKLYGTDAKQIGVYIDLKLYNLWTGLTTSPYAVMLRDKANFINLTGFARMRAFVRTNGNHTIYPIVKLADGTLILASRGVNTEGDFLWMEFSPYQNRWYTVDPVRVTTGREVMNPDLGKIDEIGFVDMAPGGGHGDAGYANISTIEVYAKPIPRS